ncbi:MAG: XRE family transcriptional regulator [Chlamydiota bacterium]
MSKFFEGLKKGLEDAIAFEKGKKTLRTRSIELPEPPMEYKAQEIKKIRKKGRYSQGVFAVILNVSIRTVQSWECGARIPSHSALRLLEIIDKGIYRPKIRSSRV